MMMGGLDLKYPRRSGSHVVDICDVGRAEFDALKRDVEALKSKDDALSALVDLCERTAARYRDEFRKAYVQKDDGAALANSTGAVCWEEVGRRLAAILKTTE